MVNTVMLLGIVLAIFASVVDLTARTGPDLNPTEGTDSNGNVISDMFGEPSQETRNDTYLMPLEEFDLDNERPATDRRCCRRSEKCKLFGGFCVKSRADCDGMVDPRGCKGRRCKCCIPVPSCTTTTDVSTTADLSTTSAVITTQDPCSFEDFHGRIIRRTISSDTRFGSYDDCLAFCDQCGAKPFIPKTEDDYELYKVVRIALGEHGYMWLPANDILEEGTLRWYNGEVASNIELWDWTGGEVLALNSDYYDWLFYGLNGEGPAVYLIHKDNFHSVYPPICELIQRYE